MTKTRPCSPAARATPPPTTPRVATSTMALTLALLPAAAQAADTSWQCVSGIGTPVRIAGGEVECAATDARNCLWASCGGKPVGDVSVPGALRPLRCSAAEYANAAHWCAKVKGPLSAVLARATLQQHCGKQVTLRSWKGDGLHRPESPQGVTSWSTGKGNEWTLLCDASGKVRLRSWKGDFLHRPDSPQGVTTWSSGVGNEWTAELIDDKLALRSWKGDYLHRPDSPQGVTTWTSGVGNQWTLVPVAAPPPEAPRGAAAGGWRCLEGIGTPVRVAGADVQCASVDGKSCLWGRCPGTSVDGVEVPEARAGLTCGADHAAKFGGTGYGDPKHWCSQAAPALGVRPLYVASILGDQLALDVSGHRLVGFEKAIGGQLLLQRDDLMIVVHKRMTVWWGNSVVRALSIFSGGHRVTLVVDEQATDHGRRGFPDNRLGLGRGVYVRGPDGAPVRAQALREGDITFTAGCLSAFLSDCVFSLPNGEQIVTSGGPNYIGLRFSVRADQRTKGWLVGQASQADVLRADGR